MSILITTIGQRDVQVVQKDSCYPFDRFDLMKIQEKIFKNEIHTEWQPYKDGSDSLHQSSRRIKYDTVKKWDTINITFPLLEKILRKVKKDLKKNKLQNLQKIFLYYTDRHEILENCEDEGLKRFIQMEPWYFAQLFQKHFPEIRKKYNLSDFPENIELIKIVLKENEINRSSIIQFIDNDLRSKISYLEKDDPLSKAIVACSGGLPDVKNVIEEVCSLYFPDNCYFYDQDQKNDNIMHSLYHEYKKQAKEKFELKNSISNWDFAVAYSICSKPISFVDMKSDIYALIELAHEWLSGDPKKATQLCDKMCSRIGEKDQLFKIMKKMISEPKNSSTRSLLRLMHLYRTRNYWGAATVLITTVENLCIRFIDHIFPKCYRKIKYRCYFDAELIDGFEPNHKILKRYSKQLVLDNWDGIEAIITFFYDNEATSDFKEKAKIIKDNFLIDSAFHKFKNEQRNEFIHNGDSLQKAKIDNLLFAKNNRLIKPDYNDTYLGSPMIKQIATTSAQINLDLINWLPVISKEIISKLKY